MVLQHPIGEFRDEWVVWRPGVDPVRLNRQGPMGRAATRKRRAAAALLVLPISVLVLAIAWFPSGFFWIVLHLAFWGFVGFWSAAPTAALVSSANTPSSHEWHHWLTSVSPDHVIRREDVPVQSRASADDLVDALRSLHQLSSSSWLTHALDGSSILVNAHSLAWSALHHAVSHPDLGPREVGIDSARDRLRRDGGRLKALADEIGYEHVGSVTQRESEALEEQVHLHIAAIRQTHRMSPDPTICASCGRPRGNGRFCRSCADADGNLRTFDECFADQVRRQEQHRPGRSREEQEAGALSVMALMPAWRDHPRVAGRV